MLRRLALHQRVVAHAKSTLVAQGNRHIGSVFLNRPDVALHTQPRRFQPH